MTAHILSAQNPKIKQIIKLRERRHREAAGVLLIEGAAELQLAVASGVQPATVFHCEELNGPPLIFPAATQIITVARAAFEKIAYRENPDGWLAIAPTPNWSLSGLQLRQPPLLLVAEAVEKPGNLGAMLRTADAAGVDALLVCDPATDLGNPNVIRASRGALFTVPVAQASTAETLNWLKRQHIQIVAATPSATANYTAVDMRGPVAIAVGAEDDGLSAEFLQQADVQVRIPMVGRVNSLNVSTSAALLLYEAVRQRSS
jgi:TrmH family RNA methyltransferase